MWVFLTIESNRWTDQELVTFFHCFKDGGKKWKYIQENLKIVGFHRSTNEIKQVYRSNKGYLSLPSATAKDFVTIVNNSYEEQEESDDSEEDNVVVSSPTKAKNEDNDIYCQEEINDGKTCFTTSYNMTI